MKISARNTEKYAIMNYIREKYFYIHYVTDGPRDCKITCKTENYSKLKYIVLRFHCNNNKFWKKVIYLLSFCLW